MTSDALRLAVGTLTAFPVAPPRRVDRSTAGRAMLVAPLVIVPVAAATAATAWLVSVVLGLPDLVAAGCALACLALASRALHLDGLADTADGLSVSYDREKALEVMRRGDIGPSGVGAICLVLLVDAGALTRLVGTWQGAIVAGLCVVVSRAMLPLSCVADIPAARGSGLGQAVAASVSPVAAATVIGAVAVVTVAFGPLLGIGWWAGPLCLIAAVVASALLLRRAVTRFGGVTGDVLGAVVELSFAAALVTAAAIV